MQRWPKCATKRATHRRKSRLFGGRAKHPHPTVGLLRRWLLGVIFPGGTVLLLSGCACCSVTNHSAVVLECAVCKSTALLATVFCLTVGGALSSVCSPLTVSGSVEAGSAARGAESPLDALAGWRLFARARGPRHFTVPRHACAAFSGLHASWGPLCFCLFSVRSVHHLPPRWTKCQLIGKTLCWMCSAKTFAKKVLARCWASSGLSDHFAQDSVVLTHTSRM